MAAVFRPGGELLLLQRRPDQRLAGLWTFPGGKIEVDEQPLQAAVRELEEETGIRGKQWRHLGRAFADSDPDVHLHFVLFICTTELLEPPCSEAAHRWCSLDQLEHIPMPPINQRFVRMLRLPEVAAFVAANC